MRISRSANAARRSGSAVLAVILLLAIVTIYIGANVRAVSALNREIKLVERQQLRRLQAQSQTSATNSPSLTPPPAQADR